MATLRDSASKFWTYRPIVFSRTSRIAFLAMVDGARVDGWKRCSKPYLRGYDIKGRR